MGTKIVFCLVLLASSILNVVRSKLLVAHVIFRHGEKTADNFVMLPDDPYINHTFYPYGPSQLTNKGKRTAYSLGKTLRERYGHFLGDIYLPNLVDAWSSSFDRCQCSLQLVLASLFPPKGSLIWNEALNWQPIPYNVLERKHDNLFTSFFLEDYKEEYYRHALFGEGKKITEEAQQIFSYVKAHSNATIKTLRDIFVLNAILIAEEDYSLPLPDWINKIYPQPLADFVLLEYNLQTGTKSLKKKVVGRLLKKLLEDSDNRIKLKSKFKFHLYSAHEMTIVWVLSFLGLMYAHHPGYAACLVLELHEEDRAYFMEVHYREDQNSKFELLRFPNGEKRLYLHRFRNMVHELFEEEDNQGKEKFNAGTRSFETHPIYLHLMLIAFLFCYCLNCR